MSIHLEITQDTVSPALAKLAGTELQSKALLAMGTAILGVAQRSFRDPSMRGADWPARASGGHPLLLLSGTLRNSLHVSAGGDSVKVGSPTVYAAIHQLGGVIVPKTAKRLVFSAGGKKVFAKKVTIPARPFLPFDRSGKLIPVAEQEVDEAIDGIVQAAAGS